MYLQQLSLEGYTIYVVSGNIPVSEADHEAKLIPIPPHSAVKTPQKNIGKGYMLGNPNQVSDPELEAAIRESMVEDDKSFTQALSQSRDEFYKMNKNSSGASLLPAKRAVEPDQELMRLKRLEKFSNK
jgi:hypothetical protein